MRWWGRYDPENDRPVAYWPLLRRPGVPNAPDTRAPVWMATLYGIFVVVLLVAVVALIAFVVASSL